MLCHSPLVLRAPLAAVRVRSTFGGTPHLQLYACKHVNTKKKQQHQQREEEAHIAFDPLKFVARMQKSVEKFQEHLGTLRLGRAHPALLEGVVVVVDGTRQKLNQVGQVVVKDPQTLQVIFGDAKTAALADKAIRTAGLNLNPQLLDGNLVRVPIPKMSKEYRDNMVKQVAKMAEETRTHIRHHRQEARKKVPKDLPSEEVKILEREIQLAHDQHCKEVDRLTTQKTKEIQQS